ncbi:immunoglobulin kappa light chain-like [Sphaeramia orbicularis]|uniref:immunoglobulin kappa light chain-like n=1 Tax=Sphaeramia orbicularis TaxID=375764 RepID=UPI00117E7FAC|nr:immunoglobulin kappa light chain-like [Sphaeramia orbicularis]
MMTPLKFALFLNCLFFGKIAKAHNLNLDISLHQDGGHISANVGENVTLRCSYEAHLTSMFYWYKQILGQKPRLISTLYKHGENGVFNEEFKDDPRFRLESSSGKNHLMISDLRSSDSATYYCTGSSAYGFDFSMGVTVLVRSSDLTREAFVRQSSSEIGSGTLKCTVHTGFYDGEHNFYWFTKSGDPHPGIIYTQGGKNEQTHTCLYNLPIQSVNHSNTGTYCAVASCGNILFKNEMKSKGDVDSPQFLVYFLSGALAFTIILTVFLAFSIHKMNKRNSCQSSVSQTRRLAPSTANTEGDRNEDDLHYAALSTPHVQPSRRQWVTASEHCVYSSVRQ